MVDFEFTFSVDDEQVMEEDDGAWQPNVDFSVQPLLFLIFSLYCVANCNQLELMFF